MDIIRAGQNTDGPLLKGHVKLIKSFFTSLENQLRCAAEIVLKALRQLFFVLIVFITPENMSCIHVKHFVLGVNENSTYTFHAKWNELVTFQDQLK